MRLAGAIAPLYPPLNLDLLIAGVLFHDSGKLWENHLPETGFTMGYDERGELIGHISIGLELVNSLWRNLQSPENIDAWKDLVPASEDVRLHLLAFDRRAPRRNGARLARLSENAGSDGAALHR